MSIIGIDLGTTNSAAAIWQNGQAELIPNRLNEYLTPSVVHISQDGKVLVGRAAQERLLTHPNATASVFKRYMGTDRQLTLAKKTYSAPELSAFVLKSLKEDAENYLGEAVTEAVISVPAYFNNIQRKATILAGELAGLKVERLINEPTAAAIAYGLHEKPEHTQFIVLDLGGGTFDVSIMEYFEGVLEVHASAGDNYLGGEDFTGILVSKFLSTLHLNKTQLNPHELQLVQAQMEQAKRQFNQADVIKVEPFLKAQKETISLYKEDFIKLSEPLWQRLQRPIETALRDAKLKPADLDEVILVGGATRMQYFRSLIAKMFRRVPSANLDPDLVVAMGASIQAGLKARDQALEDMVLTDVCPYSLGVGTYNENDHLSTQGDLFSPIIERNTVIPCSRMSAYYTVNDNQTKLNLEFFQGEHRLVKNNISLGQLEVRLPKAKRGEEGVTVRLSYDVNGVLEVDVEVISTGEKHYKMILNTPSQLNEQDIAASKAKLSALKFHPREQEMNLALLARAERLYEGRLGDQREAVLRAIRWFESILEQQDPSAIGEAQTEFSQFLDTIEQDRLF
ncbi:molecular chaperone HscC [Thiolinea disciformis]|uniref:molecular chaperone HscC n=1 Tax=Thiolinea disciformis TaxID=125614 RepID=UPI000371EC95|nr:molecular chaperone HscC [Thiolinea disciformis]